ncbi:MAG: TlpA family protein disulfide reductase [Bacteroidia bacterium]
MKRVLLNFCLMGTTLSLGAQDLVTLKLNEGGKDRYFETSKLIAPVFQLSNDSIESYQGFGVSNDKPLERFKVVLPEFGQILDTGYTFLFSEVTDNSMNGYTAVLVANYGRRHLPAVIYVDHNNNFNFTDDGEPDTFQMSQAYLDVDLNHPQIPDRKVTFRLSRFDFMKDFAFKRMADELIKENCGTKHFVGTVFSFREQRFNIRYSNCVVGTDSFQVALQDLNYNGLYNEPGIDRILLNDYGTETQSTDYSFPIEAIDGSTYFERGFKSYRIQLLDEYGRSLQFKYDPNTQAKRQLKEGKKVPRIKFTDSDGKEHKLRWYRKKPVYIYFWNRDAEGFEEDTAALSMIQEKFCPMIKIIALNYGDNPKTLNSYVRVNGVHYLSGTATKAIIKKYQLEAIPYGFLLKKRLRLHKKGVRPAELLQMLENGEIQSW